MISVKDTDKPIIFITMGDPSGIGPEVMMKAMASSDVADLAIFALIGDVAVLEKYSEGVDIPMSVKYSSGDRREDIMLDENAINILDPGPDIGTVEPGMPTKEGAEKSVKCLDLAVELMQSSTHPSKRALVTAPLSKEKVADICPGFVGHTEFLQEAYGVGRVTMALVGEELKVIPVTRHIPLKDVASRLTKETLKETLEQVIENRRVLCGKDDVVIGVSGLNPHNGENGKVGTEELDIIAPVVEEVRKEYSNIEGPVPADVIFYKALRGKVDVVIGMYHDQCLSPFKMVAFDTGVNMTLGLGQVRTSPDHGTAFDIAGKGIADPGSMISAIKLAARAIDSNS